MVTSLCTEYYQFMLAQGVLGDLANGLTYTPSLTTVNQYFFQKRPLAMGIALSGSSLMGFLMLASSLVPVSLFPLMRPSERPEPLFSSLHETTSLRPTDRRAIPDLLGPVLPDLLHHELRPVRCNRRGHVKLSDLHRECRFPGRPTAGRRLRQPHRALQYFVIFSGIVIGLFLASITMTAKKPNEIGSYLGMAFGILSSLWPHGHSNYRCPI